MVDRMNSSRIEVIQIIRFVAAFMVLMTHSTFYIHERISKDVAVWSFGESGVPIFFMVSGVVMVFTGSRLSRGLDGAVVFLLRRIVRVVPLYWLVTTLKVVLSLVVPAMVLHNHFDIVHVVKSYFFVPYFNQSGEVRPIHGVGWTLFHEMFFYFSFSFSLLLRVNPVFGVSLFLIGMLLLGELISFESAAWVVATSPINVYFVLGLWVGYVLKFWPELVPRFAFGLFFVSFVFLLLKFFGFSFYFDFLAVLFSGFVLVFARFRSSRFLSVFSRLGDSSYSLYLFHPILAAGVVAILGKFGISSVILILCSAVTVSIALSHVIHLKVEVPLISLFSSSLSSFGLGAQSRRNGS